MKRSLSTGDQIAQILQELEDDVPMSEAERRRNAWQQLEALAARVQARNADLTAVEIEQLADQISRETIQRIIEK